MKKILLLIILAIIIIFLIIIMQQNNHTYKNRNLDYREIQIDNNSIALDSEYIKFKKPLITRHSAIDVAYIGIKSDTKLKKVLFYGYWSLVNNSTRKKEYFIIKHNLSNNIFDYSFYWVDKDDKEHSLKTIIINSTN